MRWEWDLALLACLLAILGLLWYVHPVRAHSWYDADCCSDNDCHPIDSCDELHEQPDGSYRWTSPKGQSFSFRKDRVRPSKDAHCHVCVLDNPPYYQGGLCAYIQLNF